MEKEMEDALRLALKNEIIGEKFYRKTAKEAKNVFTKNTFNHIADDEIDHIRKIKEFIETGKAGKLESKIKKRNPKSGMDFFEMNEKEFKKQKEKYKGSFAPYKFAIDLEIRSYELYQELGAKAQDSEAKAFFDFLMKEEATHKKILEESLEFLQNPENYFLETEGWHFD